jgi:hypothetical protein
MQEYMTRRMVAAREMTYAEWPLRPGDEFCATPVDAEYFLRTGRAKDASSPAPAEFAPAQQIVAHQPIHAAEAVEIEPEDVEPAPEFEPEQEQPRTRRAYVRRKAA